MKLAFASLATAMAAALAACPCLAADWLGIEDVSCLHELAAASPTTNLAVNYVAGHCRLPPTAAAASWLVGTPLVRDMAMAVSQRTGAGSAAQGLRTMPRVPQDACIALAKVIASTTSGLCTASRVTSLDALPAERKEALSARCERALSSAASVRVQALSMPPEVVLSTEAVVACVASAEVSTDGQPSTWRQLRVALDARTDAIRSLDIWPMSTAAGPAP